MSSTFDVESGEGSDWRWLKPVAYGWNRICSEKTLAMIKELIT